MKLTPKHMKEFAEYLCREERSAATREKYLRDVQKLLVFSESREIAKELVVDWKKHLIERGYTVRSINSMLAAVHKLLDFLGYPEYKVKCIRTQQQVYCAEELTKNEYTRLLSAARPKRQLYLLLQTICATGIRVSELQYFTVEALKRGEVTVDCKNKTRTVLVPGKLQNMLLQFAKKQKIAGGPIFVTKSGKPLDRSNIWSAMKKLCALADVAASKVFPHNLRKLFARTFYAAQKDIAKLADILGHSSINTTRIYIISTGTEHRRKIEQLHLILYKYHILCIMW